MKYTTLSIRTPELDRGCQQRKPMKKRLAKIRLTAWGTTTLNNTQGENRCGWQV